MRKLLTELEMDGSSFSGNQKRTMKKLLGALEIKNCDSPAA
jgi:hypothetical protein